MNILIISLFLLLASIAVLYTRINIPLTHIIVIGLFIRLITINISVNVTNYDTNSYEMVAKQFVSGNSIYPFPADEHHPYFPLIVYIEAFSYRFKDTLGSQTTLLRFIFSLADVCLILIIANLRRGNTFEALIYALNPIPVLVASYQGQFDSIPLIFLLLSLISLDLSKIKLSYALLSLAIGFKTWPVLFAGLLLKNTKDKRQIIILFTIPVISSFLYLIFFPINPFYILRPILYYRGVIGDWGLGYFISHILPPGTTSLIIMSSLSSILALFLFISSFFMQGSIYNVSLKVLLLFFSLTPGFGIQWNLWLIPFLLIIKPNWWKTLLLTISLYQILVSVQWQLCQNCNYLFQVIYSITPFIKWLSWITIVMVMIQSCKKDFDIYSSKIKLTTFMIAKRKKI